MLGWADYLVIAIVLMISAGIGVYYRFTGGRQKTAEVRLHPRFNHDENCVQFSSNISAAAEAEQFDLITVDRNTSRRTAR